ncbi:MAG: hypothetical protein R3C61_17735 [Bacteroidia bacterium]
MIVELLRKIGSLLEDNGIPYMLSGSVALGFYTIARTTRDIDIIVELNQADVDKFISAFSDFFVDDIGIKSEVKEKECLISLTKQLPLRLILLFEKKTSLESASFPGESV